MRRKWLSPSLCISLWLWGCAHAGHPTVDVHKLSPLKKGDAVETDLVRAAMREFPNDASLLAMEQGFAILREEGLHDDAALQTARSFLETAFYDFQNLQEPENLNLAFTPDAEVPYKGRPHERVLTATTLALLDILKGRCDLALPTLRAAEFLDARWQPFPYGTDAPLVYTLMNYCSQKNLAADSDRQRARDGLYVSLRTRRSHQALTEWLEEKKNTPVRQHALTRKLAHWLWAQAAPGTLLQYPNQKSPHALITRMSREALRLGLRADQFWEATENQEILERSAELTFTGWETQKKLRQLVKDKLAEELHHLEQSFLKDLESETPLAQAFANALGQAAIEATAINAQIDRGSLTLAFFGTGPSVALEGTYQEIARILGGNHSSPLPPPKPMACNTAQTHSGRLAFQLCRAPSTVAPLGAPIDSSELWNSSYQATTVVGRKFERILEGRANFKSGAEDVGATAAESSFFFFDLGTRVFFDCINSSPKESVTAACLVVAGIALGASAVSAGVAGAAFVAGSMVNAAADHRYVHSLFESVSLTLEQEDPLSASVNPQTNGGSSLGTHHAF